MAYYFLFPETDTTIYSHPDRKGMNTGMDEILEIVKEKHTDQKYYPSRILIKFKNEEIQNVIRDVIGSTNFNNSDSKVNLKLYVADATTLASTLNLQTFALSQSFYAGSGRYSNLPTSSNGATWIYRDDDVLQTKWRTSSFAAGSTGSILTPLLTQGGGEWYTGSGFETSQQFLHGEDLDTNFDVTSIVKKFSSSLFVSNTYPTGIINNGFLIKQPDTIETNTTASVGDIQYFSSDTHTIYPPKLIFKWDDSTHPYASQAKQSGELNVTLYRNQEEYNQNDEALFRIHVRDKYPTRTFSTTSNFLDIGYFTTASHYSVRDAYTEEEIIPFDDKFTKLSADSEGMFFKLYMKGLQPERYYRLLFKHKNNEGVVVYDNNYHFKVIR